MNSLRYAYFVNDSDIYDRLKKLSEKLCKEKISTVDLPILFSANYESGELLSKKINNGEFPNFTSICECIFKILEALKPIHEKGFLCLTISPENVHFSDAGIARLIDYTSAFHIDDDLQNWILSFTEGYSANELIRNSNHKQKVLPLNYAADLYSITAIFFRLLVGRTPKKGDWASRSKWQLNNKTGYLKGASDALVKKTNDFLLKGLSLIPAYRFNNIEEMQEAVEELRKL
jgi:serine/threonine protein kinase